MFWLAEARGRADWARTSAIMCLIANANRDPKKSRPFKPEDFDPYAAQDRRAAAIEMADLGTLKAAFVEVKNSKLEIRR